MGTIRLPPDFREFLQLLNAHQVEYLLVGGYAVGYHGYPRATVDMDIWIGKGPSTATKMVAVLRSSGSTSPISRGPFAAAKSNANSRDVLLTSP